MKIFKSRYDLQKDLQEQKKNGASVGFVPTMGALHDGHIALVTASKKENDITVCSIFVNPAQFNDKADFEKYPQTLDKDIHLLTAAGCDILFAPAVDEVYHEPEDQNELYDLGFVETVLEGQYRPGHFQGVCKVMNRLLTLLDADNLYMGQKDYQQCMVIKKLIELSAFPVQLHVCKTIREEGGLAMSSRNLRLSLKQKENALAIYQSLIYMQTAIHSLPISTVLQNAKKMLTEAGFEEIDYISIAAASDLSPIHTWDGKKAIVALIAAFMGEVRLIDNMILAGS